MTDVQAWERATALSIPFMLDTQRLQAAGIIREAGEADEIDPLTFVELRAANVSRLKEFPGHRENEDQWTANDWAVALVGEVGELCNKLKKIRRGVPNPGDQLPSRQEIVDELADCQMYLDLLAANLTVDLAEATRSKFNRTSDAFGLKTRMLRDLPPEAMRYGQQVFAPEAGGG